MINTPEKDNTKLEGKNNDKLRKAYIGASLIIVIGLSIAKHQFPNLDIVDTAKYITLGAFTVVNIEVLRRNAFNQEKIRSDRELTEVISNILIAVLSEGTFILEPAINQLKTLIPSP